ncbi:MULTISPECIES: hypothetical protein [Reichenbachiella]|nr:MULTISPECIES: hypothetical protein [Reichenbachiella]MBU2916076.1 hypothetical protein [Reichenbachiella agariperforans]RJE71682.1 hypothetical protein BGP76_06230 [Reichenbachiella sp. MSK19-1]
MKSLILTFFLSLSLHLGVHAQYMEMEDPEKQHAVRKVEQYSKLKRTGFTMLGGGVLASLIGAGLIASSDWEKDPYTGQYYTDSSNAGYGIIAIVYAGIPLIAGGTTLAIIGNYKEKSYMRKLDNLSASYFNKQGAHGMRLTYAF